MTGHSGLFQTQAPSTGRTQSLAVVNLVDSKIDKNIENYCC